MIEWDADVDLDRLCHCEGWLQEGADGPWCGECGHHSNDHINGPCDPEDDDA